MQKLFSGFLIFLLTLSPAFGYGPDQPRIIPPASNPKVEAVSEADAVSPVGSNPTIRDVENRNRLTQVPYSPYGEAIGENSNYTVGIDDVITVVVRDQADFSGRFMVDPDGNIQYPFVGDLQALGKTKAQLKAQIVGALRKYIHEPEVSVILSEYRSKSVYVFGYVNNPGKFPMKGDKITVKEALALAGLPRFDAALDSALIVRPSEYTEDGRPHSRRVNLKRLLHQGDSSQDFILQPGDTIVIHQKFFDKFLNNFSRIVSPIFQTASLYRLSQDLSGRHKSSNKSSKSSSSSTTTTSASTDTGTTGTGTGSGGTGTGTGTGTGGTGTGTGGTGTGSGNGNGNGNTP